MTESEVKGHIRYFIARGRIWGIKLSSEAQKCKGGENDARGARASKTKVSLYCLS